MDVDLIFVCYILQKREIRLVIRLIVKAEFTIVAPLEDVVSTAWVIKAR
ncbi:hypothetical protein O5O45_19250 [Hahella aquimaris]|nr:hypothetical protein [Hahella sp. HNIBRBA332]WLQ11869.1 hypothetical protein O5O45_19250 [Hahella sp. HNIBRBA332]